MLLTSASIAVTGEAFVTHAMVECCVARAVLWTVLVIGAWLEGWKSRKREREWGLVLFSIELQIHCDCFYSQIIFIQITALE